MDDCGKTCNSAYKICRCRTVLILIAVLAVVLFLQKGTHMVRDGRDIQKNLSADTITTGKEVKQLEKAAFAAGCFWGVEAAFRRVDGVVSTAVGFMGGTVKNPTYEDVCRGDTGHAETVQLEYNPEKVSYEQLLDLFWSIHDPTTPGRQGPDIGSQYRSVIFYYTAEQELAALASMKKLEKSGKYGAPVVTRIVPATEFYRAEEYHQQYYEKRGVETTTCPLPSPYTK